MTSKPALKHSKLYVWVINSLMNVDKMVTDVDMNHDHNWSRYSVVGIATGRQRGRS
jgi:hypothetical protein